ncbi:hypothetical protein TPB0596_12150 [Tsukamurella pulmonis]|uniref:hypothetical protein n=1 Tax=Tsukamurella pulmonis TaxID=47312 RepID=UPI001EDEF1F9|nr:hypothetical protein [Tsukamurella pulmonis]BDD81452.1 hypothetical protein TPB0596_12150 [Tsukamurella pulmonis]
MPETRTVVTVHPTPRPYDDHPDPIRYEGANGYELTDDNVLCVIRSGTGRFAAWAPGTWSRAELTEEPNEEVAELIARRHYDGLTPFETSRDDDGPESLANKLTAAALDGLRA